MGRGMGWCISDEDHGRSGKEDIVIVELEMSERNLNLSLPNI